MNSPHSISFQRFSYINPNFYTTKGFESEVHGGATWFNANQTMNIYPLDWSKEKISNKVLDYLNNEKKNEIILNTLNKMDDYDFINERLNAKTVLPWASSIDKHKEVYFDFEFLENGISIIPFTLLWGNSSRAFLEKGSAIENKELYNQEF